MSESARDEALRLAREAGISVYPDADNASTTYNEEGSRKGEMLEALVRLVALARQECEAGQQAFQRELRERVLELEKKAEADARDAARWRTLPKIAEHFAFNYLNLKDAVDATLRRENVL